jgi:hypothetical protein
VLRAVIVPSAVRAVAVAMMMIATSVAHAENGFVWQAPASCPDGEDVRARIERRLGAPLEIHGVEVAITRNGSAFVAHVDTRGVTVANQIRTLTSARCEELADAVAVVVARLASEWRAREATRVAITPPAPAPIVIDRESTHPPAERMWRGGVRMLALSGIGTVPRVGIGGELSVFAIRRNHYAELGVARWVAQSAYLVQGAPGRVEVGLDVVTARAGWAPQRMPLRAWLGGEFGSMRGQGAGFEDPRGGQATWIAVTAGFGVGWPMSRYARLVGTFEVAVPTSSVRFAVNEGGDIYRSSWAAARCALGLELGLR